MASKKGQSVKITIEGSSPQELSANLAEILLRGWRDWDEDRSTSIEERAEKIVAEKLDKQVSSGVASAVEKYTEDRAREVVEKTLADGIKRTNDYGQVQRTQTWQEFITEQLVRDRYQSDKIERLAKETIERLFKNELNGLLKDISTRVKAQVDDLIGEKIKGAIRDAAGIKS